MNTQGLFLGIDIDEDISQVCCYDKSGRNVVQVQGRDNNPYFQNNIPLSLIYKDEGSAPERLAAMLKALVEAAILQTGEEKLVKAGICIRDYSEDKRKLWHAALERAGIAQESCILMGREEVFAYYAFSADPSTYARGVVLFDISPSGLNGCFLQRVNYKGLTLLMQNDEKSTAPEIKKAGSGEIGLNDAKGEICTFLKKALESHTASSIYLTGAAFDTDEIPADILSVLGSRGRRIFAGLNLYAKGACIGALALVYPLADPFKTAGLNKTAGDMTRAGGLPGCIMVCKNRISSDVCIIERLNGEPRSRALVSKGSNADASSVSIDVIPDDKGQIQLDIMPLTRNTPDTYIIQLESDKDFGAELVRVNVGLYFPDEDQLLVSIRGLNASCKDEDIQIDLRGSDRKPSHTRLEGVIVCRSSVADSPYIFPATGDEIYYTEELVKFLYENVYLSAADGGFVNDNLFSFLRAVGEDALAERLTQLINEGAATKDILIFLFKEVNFYSPRDITIIEPVIEGFKTGKRVLIKYGRAESYIKRGCYSKAVKELQEIMEQSPDSELPESFYAKVLYNAGVCYTRCLMYENAARMFEGSYGFVKDEAVKSAALLARRLSGTEPEILYMKGEWEKAGERARELKEASEGDAHSEMTVGERIEQLKEQYLVKYR